MTKAEIAALAKKGALGDPAAAAFWLRLREIALELVLGDPAANATFWLRLREIAVQLAILNERNEKLDKQVQ